MSEYHKIKKSVLKHPNLPVLNHCWKALQACQIRSSDKMGMEELIVELRQYIAAPDPDTHLRLVDRFREWMIEEDDRGMREEVAFTSVVLEFGQKLPAWKVRVREVIEKLKEVAAAASVQLWLGK